MEDHDFAKAFALTCGYFGLGVSAFLFMSGITVLSVQAQTFMGQSGPIQSAAAILAQAQIAPDDYGTGVVDTGIFCPALSITMQKGSRDATTGGQASELQAFLTDYYDLNDGLVTGGFFGKLTQQYVIRFQTEQNLPAFGIVGQLTRAKIAGVCGKAPIGSPTDSVTGVPTPPVSSGALSVSTDPSSPAYQVVAGGSERVTVGVYKFRPTGEAITLTNIGLRLDSGNSGDITQVWILNSQGATIGTAVFTGSNKGAVATFNTPLLLPKDTDTTITIKASIANIGIGQSAIPGDLIQINVDDPTQGTGVSSGQTIRAVGSTAVAGVRIFKSYPTIALVSLPNNGLEDGRLLRFSVKASPSGSLGVAKFTFNIGGDMSAASGVQLYAYTDSSFSNPVNGQQEAGRISNANRVSGSQVLVMPVSPLEIPAGQMYYFELRGTVSGSAAITTALQGDGAQASVVAFNTTGTYNFVWSPNDYTVSQFANTDWTNGYGIHELSPSGVSVSQTRARGGIIVAPTPTPTPVCGTLASGSSLSPGQSIYSCNGKYVLVYQTDGNLALYTSAWRFMWASNTAGPAYLFAMQGDGNLVVYGSVARPVWATQTLGAPMVSGAYLIVQDDGNVVMYTSSNKFLWASNTAVQAM